MIDQAHVPDETLEEYVLGQIPECGIAMIETHILACDSCLARLTAMDLEVSALKLALHETPVEQITTRAERIRAWWSELALPRLSYVALLAISLLLPQVVQHHSS